jgi:flagellar basal-body rod protein FlgB
MTEALFGSVNYLAEKRSLDVCVERQRALASNIANLETPGFRRLDVSSQFRTQLSEAVRRQDDSTLNTLRPAATVDTSAPARTPDGNSVNLTDELIAMQDNGLEHSLHVQMISARMSRLRSAISGRIS